MSSKKLAYSVIAGTTLAGLTLGTIGVSQAEYDATPPATTPVTSAPAAAPTPMVTDRDTVVAEALAAQQVAVQQSKQLVARLKNMKRVTAFGTPDGKHLGVGSTISLTFDTPLGAEAQNSVLEKTTLKASNPLPPGAWVWQEPDRMVFRTKRFLPANTRITMHSPLKGVVLADTRKRMVVGTRDATAKFSTGDDIRVRIRNSKLTAVVTRNGKPIRTMPVSMGKPGYTTRSGIKTTMEKATVTRMTNAGVSDEFYDLQVPWTVRITDTGEYLHGAPWAEGRLGQWNGSHGCTNLSVADAKWFYHLSVPGIPVITTGTGKPMETWNGAGALWNIPWKEWQKQSNGDTISVGRYAQNGFGEQRR